MLPQWYMLQKEIPPGARKEHCACVCVCVCMHVFVCAHVCVQFSSHAPHSTYRAASAQGLQKYPSEGRSEGCSRR